MGGAARLKDVAAATGFSVNTVSLALRGSPRIPEETRAQIAAEATRLNYRPNQLAKALVTQRSGSVGLILTELTNPVLTAVAQSIEKELSRRGFTTLFATSNNDREVEARMIETFMARRADGILLFPCHHREIDHVRRLRARGVPVVLLVADPDAGVDAVCMDERAGAHKAVSHLIAQGHRRIAIFDATDDNGNREKIEGYMKALEEAGIALDPGLLISPPGHDVKGGYWGMEMLMARGTGATAVFAATDSLALGALRYCARKGISVPGQMSIFGFDNIEFAEHAATALSSVNYDIPAVSRLAIERVVSLIEAKELPPPRVTQVEPDLVIRESTGPYRNG